MHDVGKVLPAWLRAFSHFDVPKPSRLMQSRLHGRARDAGERGDLVDRQITEAVVLHLSGEDARHRALTFGVVAAEIRRHDGRSAERASTLARRLVIVRPGALARHEAAHELRDPASTYAAYPASERSPALGEGLQKVGVSLIDRAMHDALPHLADELVKIVGPGCGADDYVEGSRRLAGERPRLCIASAKLRRSLFRGESVHRAPSPRKASSDATSAPEAPLASSRHRPVNRLIFSAGHLRASVARLGNTRGSKVTGGYFLASGAEMGPRWPIKLSRCKFEITVTLLDRDAEVVSRDSGPPIKPSCGQSDFAIAERPARTYSESRKFAAFTSVLPPRWDPTPCAAVCF
ncbi:hypothetical protein [Methylocystis sp. SC2]|uniref:hypothetical protein n=1 Tax=Methylocystis sp. (strain SC2) TaxID=187303 RepID=UPI00027AEF6C|nr:hypothetical protein [Methylocystis sp. SC2]CCJ08223.1 Hypothetical protein BN69_2772 [Methylocystis sp. SC2]